MTAVTLVILVSVLIPPPIVGSDGQLDAEYVRVFGQDCLKLTSEGSLVTPLDVIRARITWFSTKHPGCRFVLHRRPTSNDFKSIRTDDLDYDFFIYTQGEKTIADCFERNRSVVAEDEIREALKDPHVRRPARYR